MVNNLYGINVKDQANIYIFGTGSHARQTFVELESCGVKVQGFIDKNLFHDEKRLFNLPIYNENEFKDKTVKIVVASTFWREIVERLEQKGFFHLYVDQRRYGDIEIYDNCLCSVGKYQLRRDVLYICCPAGIGDTLYVAAYAKVLKEKYNREKVCLVLKDNQACISDFFDDVDEVIASFDMVWYLENFSITTQVWSLDNYIYAHFKKTRGQFFTAEYFDFQDNNMLELYKRVILDIPYESMLSKLVVKKSEMLTKQFGKKDIILMPYANTAPMLSMDFWDMLADQLIKKGYSLYTNVNGISEYIVTNTEAISENIYDMVALAEEARCVVALRSGMCDVLAFSKVALAVINTDEVFKKYWNVKNISNRQTIINIDATKVTENSKNEIVDMICSWIEKL